MTSFVLLLAILGPSLISAAFYMRSLSFNEFVGTRRSGRHRLLWAFDPDAEDYIWILQELHIDVYGKEGWSNKTACRTKYEAQTLQKLYKCKLYLYDHSASLLVLLHDKTLTLPGNNYESCVVMRIDPIYVNS